MWTPLCCDKDIEARPTSSPAATHHASASSTDAASVTCPLAAFLPPPPHRAPTFRLCSAFISPSDILADAPQHSPTPRIHAARPQPARDRPHPQASPPSPRRLRCRRRPPASVQRPLFAASLPTPPRQMPHYAQCPVAQLFCRVLPLLCSIFAVAATTVQLLSAASCQ